MSIIYDYVQYLRLYVHYLWPYAPNVLIILLITVTLTLTHEIFMKKSNIR